MGGGYWNTQTWPNGTVVVDAMLPDYNNRTAEGVLMTLKVCPRESAEGHPPHFGPCQVTEEGRLPEIIPKFSVRRLSP